MVSHWHDKSFFNVSAKLFSSPSWIQVVSEELLYEFMRYSQLSEDEEEQCVKIFMQADLDGNGELDSYELLQVFRGVCLAMMKDLGWLCFFIFC